MISQFIKQKAIPRLVSIIPSAVLLGLARTKFIVVYYHLISNDKPLHIEHLYVHKNIRQFTEDLDFLLANFYPVSLMDILNFIKMDLTLPKNAILLTFDDGFREMHDVVAPILLNKGVSATFFINSNFTDNKELCYQHKASLLIKYLPGMSHVTRKKMGDVLKTKEITSEEIQKEILSLNYQEREVIDHVAQLMEIDFTDYLLKYKPYLTSEQILQLIKKGFSFGAHSVDHPLYAFLSLEEQLQQTKESVNFVKEKFNLDYGAFAFPHTDIGVSKAFFEEIYSHSLVDITFGTGGIISDSFKKNIQRFSLERPLLPAREIIAYQYAKKMYRCIRGKYKIIR